MPESFTGSFAKTLVEICKFNVIEPYGNAGVRHGDTLIAYGNYYMALKKLSEDYNADNQLMEIKFKLKGLVIRWGLRQL
jgi:chemotaxis response regulator CheB